MRTVAPMSETKELSAAQIKAIQGALQKGDRVELIPQKEGVKIVHVRRAEIKA